MKKRIIMSLLLLSLGLTGCQATPEEDVVIQKNQEFEEVVEGSEGSIDDTTFPDQWKEEITYDTTELQVHVDAEVITPQISSLPIYMCDTNVTLPQNVVDAVIENLFNTDPILNQGNQNNKEQLQSDILECERRISEAQSSGENQELFQEKLAVLESLLPSAPDAVAAEPVNTDISVKNQEDYYGFRGSGTGVNGQKQSIYVNSGITGDGNNTIEVFSQSNQMLSSNEAVEMHMNDGTITKDDAIEQAESLLSDVGIQDMKLESVQFSGKYEGAEAGTPSEYGYILTFSRIAQDVVCLSSSYGSLAQTANEAYNPAIVNETVRIGITKSGVWEFSWKGYFNVGEKTMNNVKVLPFEKIQNEFTDAMKLAYSAQTEGEWTKNYRITSIVLGYAKSEIKNANSSYMLTPVWNFYGQYMEQDGNWYNSSAPLMSIDATDGSIV